jgi:hypothetical protein
MSSMMPTTKGSVATTAQDYTASTQSTSRRCAPVSANLSKRSTVGVGAMFTKFMVYTANEAVFPLHRDGKLHQNLFRVSISLSECMPDFAMCFQNTKDVFEIARGFLTAVIMDMHAAGRMALHRGRGGSSSTALLSSESASCDVVRRSMMRRARRVPQRSPGKGVG